MKKLFTLLIAMMMCLSLAACGGSDTPAETEAAAQEVETEAAEEETEAVEEEAEEEAEEAGDAVTITDKNGEEVSMEKLEELAAAYNAVAIPFNEAVNAANENGWMADEQTATEMDALSTTLSFLGTGLSQDITMLEGSDFDALINSLTNELPPLVDELAERVSVPFEG